jgi:hypothetical protein
MALNPRLTGNHALWAVSLARAFYGSVPRFQADALPECGPRSPSRWHGAAGRAEGHKLAAQPRYFLPAVIWARALPDPVDRAVAGAAAGGRLRALRHAVRAGRRADRDREDGPVIARGRRRPAWTLVAPPRQFDATTCGGHGHQRLSQLSWNRSLRGRLTIRKACMR